MNVYGIIIMCLSYWTRGWLEMQRIQRTIFWTYLREPDGSRNIPIYIVRKSKK